MASGGIGKNELSTNEIVPMIQDMMRFAGGGDAPVVKAAKHGGLA